MNCEQTYLYKALCGFAGAFQHWSHPASLQYEFPAAKKYEGRTNTSSLNIQICGKATKKMSPRKLPPTEDSFLCHIKRACLQLHIWKHALEAAPSHIDLYQFGWSKEQSSGSITPVLMTQGEAAPELLNDIICDFNDICMDNCKCSKFEQTCTAACPCQKKLQMKQ